ncbi:hypothetical protein JXB11_01105, partial [Candidatus Woesearchaeota archaeon]|nr:hypothetical protein [Candidatus Woesearchaeota archaeon]
SIYINKKRRVHSELKKRGYIETYIPHISEALKELIGKKEYDSEKVKKLLKEILEKHRGAVEDVEFDPNKNPEYSEEFALKKGEEDEKESS